MRRFTVTLADGSYDELDDWADQKGRPVANLAAFLIEQSLSNAKKTGEYTPRPKPAKLELTESVTVQQLLFQALAAADRKWSQAANSIQKFAEEAQLEFDEVQTILAGERPTTEQCLAIARILDIDEVELLSLVKRQYNGESKRQSRV